jgi:phage gpG-like protein
MDNSFKDFEIKATKLLRDFAEVAANDGLNFFKQSWTNQGFTNNGLKRWQPRKIQQLYLKRSVKTTKKRTTFTLTKEAKRANSAILIKSGDYRRSLRKNVKGLSIEWTENVPYAQIHNEGGMAGRGKKTKIPQRQTMGDSKEMMDQLSDKFLNMMDKAFK